MQTTNNNKHNHHDTKPPVCEDEVSHWFNTYKYECNGPDSDRQSCDKALFKLRCYLQWCLQQPDIKQTPVQFKYCCISSKEKNEQRLRDAGWGDLPTQDLLDRTRNYLNNGK